jgi:polyhydroxyalkanoate synthase
MSLAMSALMTSKAGLTPWSGASPFLSEKDTPRRLAALAAGLASHDPTAVDRALDRAILAAQRDFAAGIAAYRSHGYSRGPEAAPTVWQSGAVRLLDHGGDGPPALFVPSLINRGWVLDLAPGRGMLSWLAGQGLRVYRVEWGEPEDAERVFDVAGFVTERLEPALDEAVRRSGPLVLVGYCMGGLLALAAALRRVSAVRGLVLLATPWDFHAAGAARAKAMAALYRGLRPFLSALGEMPIDSIQSFFTVHDPLLAFRKFRRFARLDAASPEAASFVALEDWLNQGIPLPLPVADDALLRWYDANEPARDLWRVGATAVDPSALTVPALVVIPGADRIVPPATAEAVLPRLARATRLDPNLGHVGMVVGRGAETALWRPLAAWIASVARQ